jgi:hypothetical protein
MSRVKGTVFTDDDIKRFRETNPLRRLEARLRRNENDRADHKLTTPYIAFEVLEAWIAASAKGHTEEELRAIWMPEWGNKSMTVPKALVEALVTGWVIYKRKSDEVSLGQALQIEPQGKGSSSILKKARTRTKNFNIAKNVFIEYAAASDAEAPLTVEEAKEKVSKNKNLSMALVNDAWKNHADEVRDFFRATGLYD